MMELLRSTGIALFVSALIAGAAAPQGNLSTQGFGYPPGQISARGLATGGAVTEVDPQAAVNPATPMLWGAAVLFGQYDPEFRRVTVSGERAARTTTSRFPSVGVSFRFGDRVAAALNASTYLDRTWSSRFDREQVIGVDTVVGSTVISSEGSITDLRLALAYALTRRVNIGIGGHLFSGENRITHQQTFPDTIRFSGLVERSNISFGGVGASAGVEARIGSAWQIGASARMGGDISTEIGDSTLSRARIPTRYGAGLSYSGLQGATLSVRAAFEEWSSLRELGSASMTAFDGWDYGAGADLTGPRIGRRLITLRAGARHRTLPFGAAGRRVAELSFSTGLGIPIAINRAMLDFGVARAKREAKGAGTGTPASGATADIGETGYILSFGIRVRP